MELENILYLACLLWQTVLLSQREDSELHWSEGCRKMEHGACFAIRKLLFIIRMTHDREEHTVNTDRSLNNEWSV